MTIPPVKLVYIVRTAKVPIIMLLVQMTTIKTMILGMAAKAQVTKAQVVVILILALLLLTTGGSIESIGAYKSKHVGRG